MAHLLGLRVLLEKKPQPVWALPFFPSLSNTKQKASNTKASLSSFLSKQKNTKQQKTRFSRNRRVGEVPHLPPLYHTSRSLRSAGCIIGELLVQGPLFPDSSEVQAGSLPQEIPRGWFYGGGQKQYMIHRENTKKNKVFGGGVPGKAP